MIIQISYFLLHNLPLYSDDCDTSEYFKVINVSHLIGKSEFRNQKLTFLRPSVLWNLHRLSVFDRIFLNGVPINCEKMES